MKRLFMHLALLVLATIASYTQSPTSTSPRGPGEVLKQFCEMDAKGVRLTSQGWRKAAALFVRPEPPSPDKIIVIKDFVISPPKIEGNRAEFYVEYIYLGQLNRSAARFLSPSFPLPPDPSTVRAEYSLLLADKDHKPNTNESVEQQETRSSEWRIEGHQPEQHITVDTAIQYVTQIRDKTADPVIRKNANKTLATLKRYH